MADVLERIKADAAKANEARERNRRDFPGVAAIVDELSASFGPVRVLYAKENSKALGKPQPFVGIDVSQIIAADNWHNNLNKRGKRNG